MTRFDIVIAALAMGPIAYAVDNLIAVHRYKRRRRRNR